MNFINHSSSAKSSGIVSLPGELYIVATPIGNLLDMTYRAVQVLKEVDLIAAEDTRHSKHLLNHYDISTKMISLHDFNEEPRIESVLSQIREGKSVALISDAGTPLISDPGYRLVATALAEGITVHPIPGPCALIAALCVSGLPSDRFSFYGFLPAKKNARLSLLSSVKSEDKTIIFYESTHRLLDCLQDMLEVFGESREIVVAKELTKTFEKSLRGTLPVLISQFQADPQMQKGEFVILIRGISSEARASHLIDETRLMTILLKELSVKSAATIAAEITGLKKNDLYALGLSLQR